MRNIIFKGIHVDFRVRDEIENIMKSTSIPMTAFIPFLSLSLFFFNHSRVSFVGGWACYWLPKILMMSGNLRNF